MRSEPMLARTEDSLRLKRTLVIVSVEVGNVRFEMGALLVQMDKSCVITGPWNILRFIPYLN